MPTWSTASGRSSASAHRRPDPRLRRARSRSRGVLARRSPPAPLGRGDDENHRATAAEEPALERPEDLAAPERQLARRDAVALGDADVVLERLVRRVERVLELVALEDVVAGARLVARPVLRVDRAADRPDAALLALDPDHDPLGRAAVVDALDRPARRTVPACVFLAQRAKDTIAPVGGHRHGSFAASSRSSARARPGGPRRRVRDPRARPRPVARRHPRRPLRAATAASDAGGRAAARPAGRDQGDRRRHGRSRAQGSRPTSG